MASLMKSFVDVAPGSQFPIQNLPFGVFRPSVDFAPRPGVAIGDFVVDLSVLSLAGLFNGPLLSNSSCFSQVSSFPTHRLNRHRRIFLRNRMLDKPRLQCCLFLSILFLTSVSCIDLTDFFECVHGAWQTSLEGGTKHVTEIALR